jgi:hypothetical protein
MPRNIASAALRKVAGNDPYSWRNGTGEAAFLMKLKVTPKFIESRTQIVKNSFSGPF